MGEVFRILRNTILIVLAFAGGALAVLTLTEGGRGTLASMISDAASGSDSKITLSGLEGIWGGRLKLAHVVLEDSDGPWLVATGVEVDWSPLALLSGDFKADRVHAARIEVARPPKPAANQQPSSGGLSLPVDVAIGALDLPEIALGPAIAGGIAEISARGSIFAEGAPLKIDADLGIARTDGGQGTLDARIAFVPDENRLDIDIGGSEPAGGILANLMGLPASSSVDLVAKGSGPFADWAGEGTLSVDGIVVTRLSGTHRIVDGGSRIEAKGEGEYAAFLPQDLRPLAAGKTVFDVAATMLAGGGLQIDRADLESNAVSASASGRFDSAGQNALDLMAAARTAPVAIAFGAEGQRTSILFDTLDASVSGDGTRPTIEARVSLGSVVAPQFSAGRIEATVTSAGFDIATRTGPVSIDATIASAAVEVEAARPFLEGPLSIKAEADIGVDAVAIRSSSIAGRNVTASGSGTVSLADGSLALDLTADIAATALPEGARAPLGERVQVAGRVTRTADGAIDARGLTVTSGDLTVGGDVALAGETVTAALKGTYADLSRLSGAATGSIAFAFDASGPLAAPNLLLTVSSDRIVSGGRAITGLAVEAKGRADLANPAADLVISGAVEGVPLKGSGRLSTEGDKRTIEGLALTLGDNRIAGDLTLNENFLPEGSLDLALPDLAPLAALALQDVTGAVSGKVVFAIEGGQPVVSLDAAIPTFARGDLKGSDLSISARIDDYIAAPAVSGRIRAASVTSGATVIGGVDVALTRDGAWTGFDGGATIAGTPAKARGRVKVEAGVVTVDLAQADATVRGLAARVASPTTIVVRDGAATLDGLQVAIAGGRATLSGTAGSTLDLDVRLASLPASVVNAFAPGLGAEGTISGTAKVTGQGAAPAVAYDLDWASAATSQTRGAGFGALTLRSTGTFAGGRLAFDARAADGGGFNLDGGGSVNISGGNALDFRFSGRAPFSFLSQRLAAQGLALSGAADLSVTVSGSAGAPSVNGTIRTSGARFVDARSGIAVQDIAAEIALSGQTATLRSLTGTLSTGGALSASGTIGIDAAQGFPADLAIRIADGRYTDGRTVTTNLNGDLRLTGALVSAPLLSGTINLGRTVITVPEKLPGSLAQIDVKHRNAPAAVQRQADALRPAAAAGEGGGLLLDLDIAAPQQIFVQGRGLDAELGGTLKLTGPSAAPQAVGQFTLRRGRLSILGRRLDFSRGSIGFGGSLVPRLDFVATSNAGDASVSVQVSGPANDPAFSFSSTPTLPQDEVLAQLIFGRSMSNLSPLQIAQLAEAAAQLTGVGGGTSLLDSIRNRLGVDDLDVKTDEKTGDTSVSVGKYLNERTYFAIEKGSSSGSGKARIDLDIGRGVKLRGEAADDGAAKGGIFIEREY